MYICIYAYNHTYTYYDKCIFVQIPTPSIMTIPQLPRASAGERSAGRLSPADLAEVRVAIGDELSSL